MNNKHAIAIALAASTYVPPQPEPLPDSRKNLTPRQINRIRKRFSINIMGPRRAPKLSVAAGDNIEIGGFALKVVKVKADGRIVVNAAIDYFQPKQTLSIQGVTHRVVWVSPRKLLVCFKPVTLDEAMLLGQGIDPWAVVVEPPSIKELFKEEVKPEPKPELSASQIARRIRKANYKAAQEKK